VRDTQGDLYILRNEVAADRWELTSFRRSTDGADELRNDAGELTATPSSAGAASNPGDAVA